jgi:hypothetical protein
MIDIAIRLHDPSALSDHVLERRLLALRGRHGMRPTFTVVPHAGGGALRADDVPTPRPRAPARWKSPSHRYCHESSPFSRPPA